MSSPARSDDAPFERGTTVTVSLSDDGDELRRYFEQLSECGTVTVPMEKQVRGDEYGQLVDRFGVAWMVNVVLS